MLLFIVVSLWLRFKHRLFNTAWFLKSAQYIAPIGFLTILAGWVTTEVGRQPWTVYGLLRTSHSVSPSLTGVDVLLSLLGYLLVYLIIFPVGIFLMTRVARKGFIDEPNAPIAGQQPSSPISSTPEFLNDK